jgi:hypothetical protein
LFSLAETVATRRWNDNTRKWERYTPAQRDYPQLSASLKAQLQAIEPTHDRIMEYFPCAVLLAGGEQHDCVYLAEARSYIRVWGVWPDDDPGKRAIRIEDVAQIQPSPSRLAPRFAREMYAVGESGMGYCIFTLYFSDGTRQPYTTGNLIDFPQLPQGKSIQDVVALRPNEGRGHKTLAAKPYHWCLFGSSPRKTVIRRLVHAFQLTKR